MSLKSENAFPALGVLLFLIWLSVVGTIGYVAFHFIVKFW